MAKKSKKRRGSLQHEPWTPFQPSHYPPEHEAMLIKASEGAGKKWIGTFMNNLYQVEMAEHTTVFGEVIWLSIVRRDRSATHDWRHLQRIKNELCGPEREAIELYPAESRLVDTNNQYHLFVLPEGQCIPIGYAERDVSNRVEGTSHKQRPFQEAPADLNARAPGDVGIRIYGPPSNEDAPSGGED